MDAQSNSQQHKSLHFAVSGGAQPGSVSVGSNVQVDGVNMVLPVFTSVSSDREEAEAEATIYIVETCISNVAASDGEVVAYVHGSGVRRRILEIGTQFGNVRFALRSELDGTSDGFQAALSAVSEFVAAGRQEDLAEDTTDEKPLIVGTDGSINKFYAGGSYAWVAANGEFGFGATKASDSSLVCELTAIRRFLSECTVKDNIVILVDNRLAIKMARDVTSVTEGRVISKASIELAKEINQVVQQRKNVSLRWVKAHKGHPLNDGADRLARNFRLAQSFGQDESVMKDIARNIIQETVAAYEGYDDTFV